MRLPIPRPPRRPVVRRQHGEEVIDPYAWLAEVDSQEVLRHLRAENAYAEAVTAHLGGLRGQIEAEIRARTQESDRSVSVAYRGWWYLTRTVQGSQYPVHVRVAGSQPRPASSEAAGPLVDEQVVLDENTEAGQCDYFALGACEVSPDGQFVAYLVDDRGDERFDLRVRRIADGKLVEAAVRGAGYGLVWSGDGRYLFYCVVDEAWRPHQVWRHERGTAQDMDVLVYAEPDERFWLGLSSSRDERWLVIQASAKTTSEAWLLDLDEPAAGLRVVAPRREGVEYDVEPAGDGLLVVHNATHRDFELAWMSEPGQPPADWSTVLTPAPGQRIVAVDAFAGHAVVSLRHDGLPALMVLPGGGAGQYQPGWLVQTDEPLISIGMGDNPTWASQELQIVTESWVTPRTVSELDLRTRATTVLKRQPVLGVDLAGYQQRRIWASAPDGQAIPISLVSRADVSPDGRSAGLLYGYGAYEISLDPWFSIPRLSLLDRGLVVAIAHVRGGGEFGRRWYEQGRLAAKPTSFTDLLACATHLVHSGWVDPHRLGLQGGSAGGLLVGATLNLDPARFRVVLAEVPFVDALNTILDPTAPLTISEWEEWGNPLLDPDIYAVMRAYSPYENVVAAPYPAILATAGLHDTRVEVREPAKWVAAVRDATTSSPQERPVLLRTEMSAGHGGPSGRYDAWAQYAWEMAFVLDQLGLARA